MKRLDIRTAFYSLLSVQPRAKILIRELEKETDVILFGGCIRDYLEHGFRKMPRDFDLVLAKSNINLEALFIRLGLDYRQNKFGGFKVKISNVCFDIWDIQDTWAIRENKIEYKSYTDLSKTVFLNIDELFYNISNGDYFDEGYKDAINNGVLDIVLYDNPFPQLNLARAFTLRKKYNLVFSPRLEMFFNEWLQDASSRKDALNEIAQIVNKRYNTSIDFEEITQIKREIKVGVRG